MSRARILADFGNVTSTATELNLIDGGTARGTTAFGAGDGVVTNDGGTMRMTNIDTLDTYYSATSKTLTNKTITNPAGMDKNDVGLGNVDNVADASQTTLGTVTAGNLSNSAIVMPRFKEIDSMYDSAYTLTTIAGQAALNISHSEYLTITPEDTGDILEFSWSCNTYNKGSYIGLGIQRDTVSTFDSSGPANLTTIFATGKYAWGPTQEVDNQQLYDRAGGTIHLTAGVSGAAYYYRMIGQTHVQVVSPMSCNWGHDSTDQLVGRGVRLICKRWSIV